MPDFQLVPQVDGDYFKTVPWNDHPSATPLALAIAAAGGQAAWDLLSPAEQAARLAQYPPARPSRLTQIQDRPRYAWTGTINQPITVWAQPDGVSVAGVPDTALGGRLFEAWFVESPELPLNPSYVFGHTSRIYYTPSRPGHYTMCVRRKAGGAVVFHVDILDPAAAAPP